MSSTLTQAPEITGPETTEEEARAEVVRRFSDTNLLTSLINQAVRQAIRGHKDAGNPIAEGRDGKVFIIQPEDIVVPGE
jgi:hypothetical protein